MADDPAVALFYSYAHEDEPLRDELAGHLKILERRGLIRSWHDRRIVAGQDWAAAIDEHLGGAELVLLLVSKDFIESDYIFGVELKTAMQRHAAKACAVVPIIVRAVNLEPEDAEDLPFLKLQCLPTDMKAVTSWTNRDEAWTNVAKGLRGTVNEIRSRRPPAPPSPPSPASPPQPPGAVTGRRGDGSGPSDVFVLPGAGDGSSASTRTRSGAVPESESDRAPDVALDQVVRGIVQQVDEAQVQRSGSTVFDHERYALEQDTRTLIDMPDWKRVLWVDDRPEGNRHEMAALAKLQIEVATATSTTQAMQRIDDDAAAGEVFDLVLTDWSRPAEGADAALTLLARLRGAGHTMPVLIYHATADAGERARRAARGLAAGALGEAVLPSDLMRLVLQALAGPAR